MVARRLTALREIVYVLDEEARPWGLVVNEKKTHYMKMIAQARREPHNLKLDNYNFSSVDGFVYLGIELNEENKIL